MNAIDTHATSLDIALIVASQFNVDDTRIWSLRQVAARYAKFGDTERGVAVLDQARKCLDRQINQQHYHAALELPGFVADFVALERHDLAHEVIDDSIQIAGELKPRFAASMLAVTAEAAFEIGEAQQCRTLIERVLKYVHGRKGFRFNYDDRFDQLIPLLLKLGMNKEALGLAQKTVGFQKANAFAELARFSRGEVREAHLQEAFRIARARGLEYSIATVAEVLGGCREFSRAREIIAGIKQQHVRFEALVTLAVQLCETGRHGEAVAVLEELATDQTFFHFHPELAANLITRLRYSHHEIVQSLLRRVATEAYREGKESDRLPRLVRLAGLVALYSKAEADVIVDQVLDVRLADLGRREHGWGNSVVECIMFELLLVIADHELRWDDDRRERFWLNLPEWVARRLVKASFVKTIYS